MFSLLRSLTPSRTLPTRLTLPFVTLLTNTSRKIWSPPTTLPTRSRLRPTSLLTSSPSTSPWMLLSSLLSSRTWDSTTTLLPWSSLTLNTALWRCSLRKLSVENSSVSFIRTAPSNLSILALQHFTCISIHLFQYSECCFCYNTCTGCILIWW